MSRKLLILLKAEKKNNKIKKKPTMLEMIYPTKIVALSLTKSFNWSCILSLIVLIIVLIKLFLWIDVLNNVHPNQDDYNK